LWTNVDARIAEVVSERAAEAPEALRAEFSAAIDGMMAGVGDVLETLSADVSARIQAVGAQAKDLQAGLGTLSDQMNATAERVAALEERLQNVKLKKRRFR
jgi:hypothetical protein